MSIKIMNRVWEHSRQKSNRRLTLLAIADNANDFGIAWPGTATLARKGNISRRTVDHVIADLAWTGELAVYPLRGRSHSYIVLTNMSCAEYKAALKQLSKQRKCKTSELARLRKNYATACEPDFAGVAQLFAHDPLVTVS